MALKPQHLMASAVVFGTALYGGYNWSLSRKQVPNTDTCGCAFDRLAAVYDNIVGCEETVMMYGSMRKKLLREAKGDVLELSAGTGRNLPYFPYKNIRSLTLTDVSTNMLQQAQRKFFDQLQLQYKQPQLTCKFLLADAQHITTEPGQQTQTVRVPAFTSTSSSSTSSHQHRSSRATSDASPSGVWRLKQRTNHGDSSGSSSSSGTGVDSRMEQSAPAAADTPAGLDRSGNADPAQASSSSSTTTSSDSSSSNNSAASASSSTTTSSDSSSSSSSWWWPNRPCQEGLSGHDTNTSTSGAGSSSGSNSSWSTFAPRSFDVVVDTFGLCSCDDPVQVLKQATLLLKPGGKLLLLEHGQSSYDWLNRYMDERAERHHTTYGCWYNRDITGIVKEADLKVDSMTRSHFGTSYLIVASPSQPAEQQEDQAVASHAA